MEIIFTSIATSICASIFFLGIMSLFRPRIKISDNIAEHYREELKQNIYTIKIYNKSYIKAVDLSCEAWLVKKTHHNDGVLLGPEDLTFVRHEMTKLDGYWKWDKDAKYAWRLSITEPIRDRWIGPDQYVELTISARHPWSGFRRWFNKKYYMDADCLVSGVFKTGKCMEIAPSAGQQGTLNLKNN